MVWRIHKELQRRKRANIENKNNCSLSAVDHDWAINSLFAQPSLAPAVCSADPTNYGSCCSSRKHPYSETANLQEKHAGIRKTYYEQRDR